MLNPRPSHSLFSSTFFRLALAVLAGALAISWGSAAEAQRKKKKKAPAPTPAPAPEEAPADPPDGAEGGEGEPAPMTPEEKQKAATALFAEGQALAKEQNYAEAVLKFEEAFALYPDPGLQFMIGESYQLEGTENRDFEMLQKSVDAYKKYVELVPEGAGTDKANERIGQLEESIEVEQDRIDRIADEEKQAALDAKLQEKKQAELLLAKEAEKKTMQIVLSGGALAGADQQLSGILRMSGGALVSWEKVALEAKVGIDGFLRVDQDQGVAATSLTLIDLGARFGTQYRFVGPFVSAGAGFGIFRGKPRERKLTDDMASCGAAMDCAISIDKNITGRLAFGYGFRSTDKSTVALRIEAQTWFFSVDEEQEVGSPHPLDIEKPQAAVALMVGLEFMRWL